MLYVGEKEFLMGNESLQRIGSAEELLEKEEMAHLRCPCLSQVHFFTIESFPILYWQPAQSIALLSRSHIYTQMILMSLTARSRPRMRFSSQLWCKFVLTVLHVFRVSQDALNRISYRLLAEVGDSSRCVSGLC